MIERKWFVRCLVALSVGVLGLTLYGTAPAQQKGKTRLAATKHLMGGINQPNCAGLGQSLKGAGPADDKAWDKAATQAGCLNEMGHLLMDDGRCPDAEWAGACKILRESSAEALAAIEKKNLADAQAAFKTLTTACAKCHKAHKE